MQLSTFQNLILGGIDSRLNQFSSLKPELKGMLIEALAGTGKSFILVESCLRLANAGISPEEVRLVVFGRKNKADLQSKLGMRCGSEWVNCVQTLNSLAFQILREATGIDNRLWKVESSKYRKIGQELGYLPHYKFLKGKRELVPGSLFNSIERDESGDSNVSSLTFYQEFEGLLEKFRLYCLPVELENLNSLIDTYNLEMRYVMNVTIEREILAALNIILKEGYKRAFTQYWIDFTDQAWILWAGLNNFWSSYTDKEDNFAPTLINWSKELRFIAVDEAQDTDLLQINLLSKLIDSRNFLVAVGDRRQAVYSFRGCIAEGMDKFKEVFNCEQFLLPINYRCGKSHLRLVREIFPDIPIEPFPEADEGEIKVLKWDNFIELFADRSLSYIGVCRRNAPLITTALLLLAQGLPVKIKDKSLGQKIRIEVEKICKKLKADYAESWQIFPSLLSEYEEKERERLLGYGDGEQKLEMLNDLLAAILALYGAYEPHTIAEWESSINKIFDESEGKAIDLYSIHSGKGGEADIAFIINPENMPLIHKKQRPEERKQEDNLLYVALTRGKHTLALVSDEPTKISWLPRKYCEENKTVTVEVIHEPLEDDEIETLQELEAAEEDNLAMPVPSGDAIPALPNELMAITLHQPWASLIAEGKKHYETRSWATDYRGLIAIHAAKKLHEDESLISLLEIDKSEVPLGAIVAIAELTDCVLMTEEFIIKQSSIEQYLGLWEPGRYAWKLENVRPIEPIPATGKQGLWKWKHKEFFGIDDNIKYLEEKQLAEILEKLENLPRPKLRTILRELVDRLGKESIADLIG